MLPILPRLTAANGGLHAEIEKIFEIAGRDCPDCRDWRPRKLGIPRLPTSKYQIATEVSDRDCWPTFPRVPILGILPAKNGRLHGEIEKIAGGDCRECRYCRECRFSQDCRDCPESLPRLPGLPILPRLMAVNGGLQAEIEKNIQVCRLAVPGMQRLLAKNAGNSEIAEF